MYPLSYSLDNLIVLNFIMHLMVLPLIHEFSIQPTARILLHLLQDTNANIRNE